MDDVLASEDDWRCEVNWISVNKKVPLGCLPVLAWSTTDGIGVAEYDTSRITRPVWHWIYKRVNGSCMIRDVTHWARILSPHSMPNTTEED